MLEFHAADHPRHLVERAETGRPVGHRQPGIVAGNQSAGNQQQECQDSDKNGEAMLRSVVPGIGQDSSLKPTILAPAKAAIPWDEM
jgi:hypothetical protein